MWPLVFATKHQIVFAHTSFKWANLASHNAGVTVAIVAISSRTRADSFLYSIGDDGETVAKKSLNINAYLVDGPAIEIEPLRRSMCGCAYMDLGNMPKDGGNLLLTFSDAENMISEDARSEKFVFDFVGSQEFVKGIVRRCLWIEDHQIQDCLLYTSRCV